MPNYVTNRVVMTGEQARIDELVRAVQFSDEALGSVDFSKVIPMPPELDIPVGTDTDNGFKLYSDFVEVYKIGLGNRPFDPMDIPARAENAFLNYRRGIRFLPPCFAPCAIFGCRWRYDTAERSGRKFEPFLTAFRKNGKRGR